eukprot:TRINITY_DN87730_c0_g1_i1.p2 TRINITY_DN87730_c0_g1~~TRINITY_DN87730_c0_g1_i1.p2  ORF type:complete len:109 (+),score=16.87 TRINITY_DN87730_c0_g1_i1:161-487(+)
MKGTSLVVVLLLLGTFALTKAFTATERCLGEKNVLLCTYCCRRLPSYEKSSCQQRCPEIDTNNTKLLTCLKNPSTCYTCIAGALRYRPELLQQYFRVCRDAMAVSWLG